MTDRALLTMDDLETAVKDADVLIDVSTAAAAAEHAGLLVERGGPALIIGATGFDDDEDAAIAKAAESIPIVKARNFSLGVTLLSAFVEQASSVLGDDWDIEIVEMHHRAKRDAPSGTALLLGEAAAKGLGSDSQPVWRITLKVPSYLPVLQHADDTELRPVAEVIRGEGLAAGLLGVADGEHHDVGLACDGHGFVDQPQVLVPVGQQHLVDGPVLGLRDEHALRVHDLRVPGVFDISHGLSDLPGILRVIPICGPLRFFSSAAPPRTRAMTLIRAL